MRACSAIGELAATELGAAYLRVDGPRHRVARHPRLSRELHAARSDGARAVHFGALRLLARQGAAGAVRRDQGHRAVAGLHRAQRTRRDGAARPRRLRHLRRLPRGQARGAPARDLDRRAGLLQRRSEGRAVGAADQEPALPRGAGNRLGRRRHLCTRAASRRCAPPGIPLYLEVHDASRVGRQRHLERARRRSAAAQGDLASHAASRSCRWSRWRCGIRSASSPTPSIAFASTASRST